MESDGSGWETGKPHFAGFVPRGSPGTKGCLLPAEISVV